jgi:ABC-type transport system involved in multi-copper enzyme maturation permease subunit
MTQAAAIFFDAYRELNARRMFWITLIISGLIDVALLLVGLDDKHNLRIAFWTIPLPMPPMFDLRLLLKSMFISVGVNLWLTWAATILAIISTASIFPDFLSGGSIDLVLAKPISRWRLFFYKYISGLLFAGFQVVIFAAAAFVIIGIRAKAWEPGLLLAIPMVLVFFSYLFCVCALVGVLTRSTIASLLATILFWLILFSINTTDNLLAIPRVANELYVEKLDMRLEHARSSGNEAMIARLDEERLVAVDSRNSVRKWHGLVVSAKTVLPKTDDTMELLRRWVIKSANLPEPRDEDRRMPFLSDQMRVAGVRASEVMERAQALKDARSPWWILGTSLIFEAAVLVLTGWLFNRRDF